MQALIVAGALVLLAGLLYCEKNNFLTAAMPVKTSLSLLFVAAAMLQAHPLPPYYHLILPGLILCVAGDFFLALHRKAMFLAGIVVFLFGHVLYVLAFFSLAEYSPMVWPGVLGVVVVSVAAFRWLKPHLGSMEIPVLVYVIVISVMVAGAWLVWVDKSVHVSARMMILAGAVAFYLSDLFVARDRFMKREFVNRLIGLPLYYGGQFLIAFSVGLL
ncbi:MAG: lysoplasmalogenase [Deltaproteobacteria bacterium]|nr:lysoplasmalogenase [Deltaproteobacteria bacterium]